MKAEAFHAQRISNTIDRLTECRSLSEAYDWSELKAAAAADREGMVFWSEVSEEILRRMHATAS